MVVALKRWLTWYLNRYSNGWNQECDICWAGHIAVAHFIYGIAPLPVGIIVFAATLFMKLVEPTDYDKENAL